MSRVPRSVGELLRDHVTLTVESIDRMYLGAWIPILQREHVDATVAALWRTGALAARTAVEQLRNLTRS